MHNFKKLTYFMKKWSVEVMERRMASDGILPEEIQKQQLQSCSLKGCHGWLNFWLLLIFVISGFNRWLFLC